jgi:hypothetical protein
MHTNVILPTCTCTYEFISLTFTITDKPSPPRNLHPTELYKDFITVAWEVPEDDGGRPITGYTVERRNAEKQTWIKVGQVDANTLTIKATKLTEGHQYFFRVVASNEVGISEPCTTDEPITAKLPFGKFNCS